jgi:hypothetical protein
MNDTSPQLIIRLSAGVALVIEADNVPSLEAALRSYRKQLRSQRNLADDIASHLHAHGPLTTEQIRTAVRARAQLVRQTLNHDSRFQQIASPPGRRGNAKYWDVSPERL